MTVRGSTRRILCTLNVSFDGGGRWAQTPIPAPRARRPVLRAGRRVLERRHAVRLLRHAEGARERPRRGMAQPFDRRRQDARHAGRGPARRARLPGAPDRRPGDRQARLPDLPQGRRARALHVLEHRQPDHGRPLRRRRRQLDDARPRQRGRSPARGRPDAGDRQETERAQRPVPRSRRGRPRRLGGGHRGRGGPPYDGEWQLVLRALDRPRRDMEGVGRRRHRPRSSRPSASSSSRPRPRRSRSTATAASSTPPSRTGATATPTCASWSLADGAGAWCRARSGSTTRPSQIKKKFNAKSSPSHPTAGWTSLYFDRRADRTDVLNEVSLQASFDEGKTFLPRVKLSGPSRSARGSAPASSAAWPTSAAASGWSRPTRAPTPCGPTPATAARRRPSRIWRAASSRSTTRRGCRARPRRRCGSVA